MNDGLNLGTFKGLGAYLPKLLGGSTGATGQITNLISNVVGFLTIIGGLTFLIYFAVGALSWITAGGGADKVEKAKTTMTNATIGMIAMVAAYAITWIVGQILGVDILNPAAELGKFLNLQGE